METGVVPKVPFPPKEQPAGFSMSMQQFTDQYSQREPIAHTASFIDSIVLFISVVGDGVKTAAKEAGNEILNLLSSTIVRFCLLILFIFLLYLIYRKIRKRVCDDTPKAFYRQHQNIQNDLKGCSFHVKDPEKQVLCSCRPEYEYNKFEPRDNVFPSQHRVV